MKQYIFDSSLIYFFIIFFVKKTTIWKSNAKGQIGNQGNKKKAAIISMRKPQCK